MLHQDILSTDSISINRLASDSTHTNVHSLFTLNLTDLQRKYKKERKEENKPVPRRLSKPTTTLYLFILLHKGLIHTLLP
jgi:hypothetical protein